MTAPPPVRVVVACPGLDHVGRGYETFARELTDTLTGSGELDVTLLKGTGAAAIDETVGQCVRRDTPASQWVARMAGRPALAYELEALSFVPSVVGEVRRRDADVLWTSDKLVAMGVSRARPTIGDGLRVLFTNGGPYRGPFPYADLVHQLTQDACDTAARHGEPPGAAALVPLGFRFPDRIGPIRSDDRRARRRSLGLPEDRPLVIAVGALDLGHKRHDHLVRELAGIEHDRPFLLCLGQRTPETGALVRLADAALGPDGYTARTVPAPEVWDHLAAADVFVLASIVEAFGRAYVEAAAFGIPCLVHDFPVAHEVLGPWGRYVDMTRAGALTAALFAAGAEPPADGGAAQSAWVRDRYDWDALGPAYVALARRAALSARRRRSAPARR